MRYAHLYGTILPDSAIVDEANIGAITTPERFKEEIRSAAGDHLTVLVSCYGGDTLAAAEMGIALDQWAIANPDCDLVIEVGALAASAAANLIALAPSKAQVLVHSQSMLMYHGCSGLQMGGAGAMKDAAKRMARYDASVKEALYGRTTLPHAEIDAWFEEGREGWLTGRDCVSCGLAQLAPEFPAMELPRLLDGASAPKIGAIAAFAAQIKEETMARLKAECDPEKTGAHKAEGEPTQQQENEHLGMKIEELEEKLDQLESRIAALENPENAPTAEGEGNGEEIPTNEPTAEGEEKTQEQMNEHFGEEIEELKRENARLKAENKRLTAGMRIPATTGAAAGGKTFLQLVREIPKGLSARAYAEAFAALKKNHPREYDEYIKAHSNR